MAGVGLLLLIACGNIAGLLMARGSARRHEVAIRVSLGARRGRLVRQMLTESVLLAMLGGAFGILVAQWSASAIVRGVYSGARTVPLAVSIDGGVLAFAAAVTVLTGLLFGIAPAWQATRAGVHEGVRGIRDSSGGRIHRVPLGRALVAAQIALSLLLVVSAGLTMRTLANVLGIEPGYEGSRLISARLDIRAAGYRYEQLPSIYDRLQREVGAVPGVKSVSMSLYGLAGGMRRTTELHDPGQAIRAGQQGGQEIHVTPGFFSTVGIRLLKGRNFGETDRVGTPSVVIVSESWARHFFGTLDVIGARFGHGTRPEFEIIGVVSDARVNGLRERPQRLVYYPIAQGPQEYLSSLEARVDGPPSSILAGIRAAIKRVDATIPVAEVRSMREVLERQLWRERLLARLAGAFGGIGLIIAAIGLYGVVAYSASRRRAEMGVRLALGASPGRVRWLVLGDSLLTVLAGLAIGAALSFPVMGVTRNLLVGCVASRSVHVRPGSAVAAGGGARRQPRAGVAGVTHRSRHRAARGVDPARFASRRFDVSGR
jgi:predicted permease